MGFGVLIGVERVGWYRVWGPCRGRKQKEWD